MQSGAISTRSAFAEATRRDDGLESRPPDYHARTHGLVYRGPGQRAWEERPHPVPTVPPHAPTEPFGPEPSDAQTSPASRLQYGAVVSGTLTRLHFPDRQNRQAHSVGFGLSEALT